MKLDWKLISEVAGNSAHKLRCSVVVDSISSTNDWHIWSCGQDKLPAVCLADQQLSGRGRNGREWISPIFDNVCLSLVWLFPKEVDARLPGLSLVIGVVLARLLATYGIEAKVKWPNDVLVNGDKIAGILIETKMKPLDGTIAIIGIGLNYRLTELTRSNIGQTCTDMANHCEEAALPDRNYVAGILIKNLINACENFEKFGFTAFIEDWNRFDICSGRDIQVHDSEGLWIGSAIGLNSQCGLRVLRDGAECVVYAADVSIKVN